MCGRVRMAEDHSETKIQLKFDLDMPEMRRPSRNLPPTWDLPGIRRVGPKVEIIPMFWSLLAPWAKEKKTKYATHNARVETMRESRLFSKPWADGQRCLIVVDAFYEWRKPDKTCFTVFRRDGQPLVFGGLYQDWTSPDGEVVPTCTIITTEPNPAFAALHDRLAFIPREEDWEAWLGVERIDNDEAFDLIKPCAEDVLDWKEGKPGELDWKLVA